MSCLEHRESAPRSVACFVLIVSDTRTLETDTGGRAVAELLEAAGHRVTARRLVRDEPADIAAQITAALSAGDVDVVITTGGTGLGRRDGTVDVVERMLERRIDGFGELFRALSYQDIGPAAMLSRACAGAARGTVIIALPGSEHAVRLAMSRLVVPELAHMVREVRR